MIVSEAIRKDDKDKQANIDKLMKEYKEIEGIKDETKEPKRNEVVETEVIRDPETDEVMHVTRRVVTEIITLVEDEENDEEESREAKKETMMTQIEGNSEKEDESEYVTKAVVTELLVDVESESEDEEVINKQSNVISQNEKEIVEEQTVSENVQNASKSKYLMNLEKSKMTKNDGSIITKTDTISTEVNRNEEEFDIPSEQRKARYIKRIIRYRINPETGEREIIDEPIEQESDEPIVIVNEFINEVQSDVPGIKKYVKRIIRKVVRFTESGEREIIDEEPIEIPIENFDQPIRTRKEELIESDSKNGKKVAKKVVTYLTTINPVTGERKEILEGQQIQSPTVGSTTTTTKEIVEVPSEEPGNAKYIRRLTRYRTNPETGEREIVDEPVENVTEEPMGARREEIVEVPSDVPGKRRFVKRSIRYLTRVNPVTGEIEIVEDKPVDEPINNFDEPILLVREEIVEVPSEEEGKKRFVKKIVRRYIKVNPITGEMEEVSGPTERSFEKEENKYVQLIPSVISMIVTESIRKDDKDKQSNIDKLMNEFKKIEGTYKEKSLKVKEVEEEPITIVNEFINEVPSNVPGVKKYIKRILKKYIIINPVNGQRKVVNEDPIEIPIKSFEQPIRTKKEELVEVSKDKKTGNRKVVKKVTTYVTTIDPVTGERKVKVEGSQLVDSIVSKKKREVVEAPSEEQDNGSYVKRIVRYRINPATGEKEVIDDQSSEQLYDESVVTVKEELVEVPTFEAGNKRFVKKVYRYITKINSVTGEKEVIEERPFEEPVETSSDNPIVILREEIVEVPSQGTTRKSFVKKIVRYLIKINPVTGEKEVVGKQLFEEPIINVKEETVEIPTEEVNNRYSRRITRYRLNPVTGEREVIDEREISDDGNRYGKIKNSQSEETKVREEIVEVPSSDGKKRLVKRITKYNTRINPTTGEREVVGEQTSEEPFEDFTREVSAVEEEIVEAPYSEPDNKRFMKRAIKYIYRVNPVTGEKEIAGKQQYEKPIQQDLREPISTVREQIVEVPSKSGKNVFIRRIIKYLTVVDPVKGTKKVVSRQTIEEPIEELENLNEVSLKDLTTERIVTNEDEYDEGTSIIGKLQRLAKYDDRNVELDDASDDDSYSGKELIDQIKNALVVEDHETNDVSDMDIQIPSNYSISEENKKNLIYKNYKEYEDFVDNEKLDKVNREESQYLRKSEHHETPKQEIKTKLSKQQMKAEEIIEDSNCCAVKSSYFKKNEEKGDSNKEAVDNDDEYDLYFVEETTVTEKEPSYSYFDNVSTSGKSNKSRKSRKNKDKDCIIM